VIKSCFYLLSILVLLGCSSPSPNKFSDTTLVEISNLQDQRKTDSLINFLIVKNRIYRAEAALALASVQDSAASPQLGSMLLEDPYELSRLNAAFALGQTGGNAAVNALIPALTDTSSRVVNEVLQALGKTLTSRDLPSLVNFQPKDSIQEHGLIWAFYFAGLRGLSDTVMTSRAVDFLSARHSAVVRLGAAHFFNRSVNLKSVPAQELRRVASEDKDPHVRMAATLALRKVTTEEHIPELRMILTTDMDYRVRANAARVVAQQSNKVRDELVLLALNDEHGGVAVSAAENIQKNFGKKEELLTIARSTKNFRVQASLFKLLNSKSSNLKEEIMDVYSRSTNQYHKASLLAALSSDVSSYSFLETELINSKTPVIKTAAAQALSDINRSEEFNSDFIQPFIAIYKKAILDGDPGVIGILASTLADESLFYRKAITDYSFLYEARNSLALPKDFEAIQPLEEAIAYFEGKKKPDAPRNQFNHPIKWDIIQALPSDQQVKIATDKGDISLQLLVEEAPGSVANFVDLVKQKYFNNKFVHRVVPNFVIQTGCIRGDGYGSEAYSIRSEFSLSKYDEGSVGMASAGKDTEATQWFITHSPAPHLDGHYTLFARVTSGMEVVHKIEVGDKILSVHLIDN
jgi:cyclophilin family peptidyl-prolyl cis-trans isomerase/HEAT repeat protein